MTFSITPDTTSISESTGAVTFTVSRTSTSAAETVYFSTILNGGTNSSDYTSIVDRALTFSPGVSSQQVTVFINNDSTVEPDETFGVIIQQTPDPNVNVFLDRSFFTIANDDSSASSFSITPDTTSISESTGAMTFTVSRTSTSAAETVYFSTILNGGTNSSDYTSIVDRALTFSPGVSSQQVTVFINNDSTVEPDETFGVIIQQTPDPNVNVFLDRSFFTIANDDSSASSFSITPDTTSISESTGAMTFTVSRTSTSAAETVYFSTILNGGTNSSDYTSIVDRALTFSPGVSSQQVTVFINNDSTVEPDETFGVIIQQTPDPNVNVFLDRSFFTIANDDSSASSFSITPDTTSISESTGAMTFTVSRTSTSAAETVYFSTILNGGTNSSDYTSIVDRALTFSPGVSSQQVTVFINNDSTVEPDETFGVIIQQTPDPNVNVFLDRSFFTIANDDAGASTYSIFIADSAPVNEAGGLATFEVSVAGMTILSPITVRYSTISETATADQDFVATIEGELVLTSQNPTALIQVPILDDDQKEGSETLRVQLISTSGATLGDSVAVATIIDNDISTTGQAISINDIEINEESGLVNINVLLSPGTSSSPVTVHYYTLAETAGANSDFTNIVDGILTIPAGMNSGTISIPVLDDQIIDGTETFRIELHSPSGATISDSSGVVTIKDNDVPQPDFTHDCEDAQSISINMFEAMALFAQASYMSNDAARLQALNYLTPLTAEDLGVPEEEISDNGLYTQGNAAAFIGVGHLNGKCTLVISFAGTDDDQDIKDWKDFAAHYSRLSQLIQGMDNYLDDHDDIEQIYVTGHSLGGAMAEFFMQEAFALGNKFVAVTFAAPGISLDPIPAAQLDPRILHIEHSIDIVPDIFFHTGATVVNFTLNDFISDGVLDKEYEEHDMVLYKETVSMLLNAGLPIFANNALPTLGGNEYTLVLNTTGNSSNDILIADETIPRILFDEYLLGLGGDDILEGGAGGAGEDHLWGGAGNDTILFIGNGDSAKGGSGKDRYVVDELLAQLPGVSVTIEIEDLEAGEAIQIEGADFSSSPTDGFGVFLRNNQIQISSSANNKTTIYIGTDIFPGADVIIQISGYLPVGAFSAEGENISLSALSLLPGSDAGNLLFGTDSDDFGNSGAGDDAVHFGVGNDLAKAGDGAGDDLYDGDIGSDTVIYASTKLGVIVDLRVGTGDGSEVGHDTLINMENVIGGRGDDTLRGSSLANAIQGGRGADSISGRGGEDTMIGGGGADVLKGGKGDDVYIVKGADAIVEKSAGGTDIVVSNASFSLLGIENVENLLITGVSAADGQGNELNNVITGNHSVNSLDGQAGDDFVDGWNGDDVLSGGTGDDILSGGEGNDFLSGQGGLDYIDGGNGDDQIHGGNKGDLLDGGLGNDLLEGGKGADIFLFNDSVVAGNLDVIADFSGAGNEQGDVIYLDNATGLFAGAGDDGILQELAFEFGAGLTAAATPEGRVIFDTSTGALYYDADGVGGISAIQFVALATTPAELNYSDFVII